MPFEAKSAEPFDPRKLNTYDAGRTPITWEVDIQHDSRFRLPEFDQEQLPPLRGIMGTVGMLRASQAEPTIPHVRAQFVPTSESRPSAFGMALAYGPEIAATAAAGIAALFSPRGKKMRNASLALVGMESAGRGLIACAPTPTEIAPGPAGIEQFLNQEGQSITFINRGGSTFTGSLTGADCMPLSGTYDNLEINFNLQKGAASPEKSLQFCTATLNLKGDGLLPDASGQVGVLVDKAAEASYVLLGEGGPGNTQPFGSLAVLKDGRLDLTNGPRYELITQSDGSQTFYITGRLADGAEGPFTGSVNVPVNVEKPTELPPFVMAAVLPLLNTIPTAYVTPVPEIAPSPTPTEVVPTPTESGPKEGDILVENGYTYTYTLVPESGYKGWFRPMADMPVWPWLAKYAPDGKGGYTIASRGNDMSPTKLMVEKGIEGEQAISEITLTRLPRGIDPQPHYTNELHTLVHKHYESQHPNADNYTYISDLQSGKIAYTFHVGTKEYTWTVSPDSGATIYIIKNDPSYLTEENGFSRWRSLPYNTDFWTAFWGVDSDGIVGAISVGKPIDQLEPPELRVMPIYHQAAVITAALQTNNVNADVQNIGYDKEIIRLVQFAGEGTSPLIDIEHKE